MTEANSSGIPAVGPLGKLIRAHPNDANLTYKGQSLTHPPINSGTDDNKGKKRRDNGTGNNVDDGTDANPLILLRRVAFQTRANDNQAEDAERAVLRWFESARIARRSKPYRTLIEEAWARRDAAIDRLINPPAKIAQGSARKPWHRLRLKIVPEWRFATGLGLNFGPHESGIALHGTYGFPIIPASTLDGLAAAAARDMNDESSPKVGVVLGTPRPSTPDGFEDAIPDGQRAAVASVTFFDALPGKDFTAHQDVITPHQKPYYETDPSTAHSSGPRPPGEHYSPEPIQFLSVSGTFHLDLLAREKEHLSLVKTWLNHAGNELGVGGRTTAGYGYFKCTS